MELISIHNVHSLFYFDAVTMGILHEDVSRLVLFLMSFDPTSLRIFEGRIEKESVRAIRHR
jgi:hypothetical protein